MKGTIQVFDEHLEKLGPLIEQGQFGSCLSVCRHLSLYSTMSDYADGLLVSEMLEGIFMQLESVFEEYVVSDEEKQQIFRGIKGAIAEVGNSYKDDDKNQAYGALGKARIAATQFQMKCWNTFPRKPRVPRRRVL